MEPTTPCWGYVGASFTKTRNLHEHPEANKLVVRTRIRSTRTRIHQVLSGVGFECDLGRQHLDLHFIFSGWAKFHWGHVGIVWEPLRFNVQGSFEAPGPYFKTAILISVAIARIGKRYAPRGRFQVNASKLVIGNTNPRDFCSCWLAGWLAG